MNKLRKLKLQQRAIQWAKPRHDTVGQIADVANGYEAGYRAAMSDARKAMAEAEAEAQECTPNPTMGLRRTLMIAAIRRFLLPLR